MFAGNSVSSISRVDVAAAIAALAIAYLYQRRARKSLPFPPGPRGLPLVGNLWDIPTSSICETYHQWCKEYNTDIIYLNIVGTPIIVLDTAEAAMELLEKRSSIYSGRVRLPMCNELMGWDFNVGAMDYGDRWRKHRRLMHHHFHPAAASGYHSQLSTSSRNMVRRFLETPDDVLGNLSHMAGEIVMSIAYGIQVQDRDDPYVMAAEKGVGPMIEAIVPGAFLVDMLPILKHVPDWMPGAAFKRKAREWRKLARAMVDLPYAATQRDIAEGTAATSFVSTCLQRVEDGSQDDAYNDEIIKATAGTLYAAGSDTTVAAIASCILGLLENPQVVEKAQHELDSVLGNACMPDFEDVNSLPYITAIVKESLRWRAVIPFGIPHFLAVEDEYKGYRLPAGSMIVANSWAMLRDEDTYHDSSSFNPDRFMKDGELDKSIRDPAHACWGFGRRICPGRYMAFSTIWIAVASLLAVYDIQKAKDEHGNEIQLTHEYIAALVNMPKPFRCSITPRSSAAKELILSVGNANPESL
ncbi:cytochrome P450 [Crassisporium funariophilum]|nr:cytochrome P450 [Crassisporium funariophilum]